MSKTIIFNVDDVCDFTFYRFVYKIRELEREKDRRIQPLPNGLLPEDGLVFLEFHSDGEKAVTSIMRRDDLYQLGFQQPNGVVWEMRGTKKKPIDQLLAGSRSLPIGYEYPDLRELTVNFAKLREYIRFLKTCNPLMVSEKKLKRALSLIAVMVSECSRFKWMSYSVAPLARRPHTRDYLKLDSSFRKLLTNWSVISPPRLTIIKIATTIAKLSTSKKRARIKIRGYKFFFLFLVDVDPYNSHTLNFSKN